MGQYCCVNCFESDGIISLIEENDIKGDCDYCGCLNVFICDIEEMGKFIRERIELAYENINDGTGSMYDSEEKCYTHEGQSLYEILYEELEIFNELNLTYDQIETLLKDMIEASGPSFRDIAQGAYDDFADIYDPSLVLKYQLYGAEITTEYLAWEEFKYVCKYYNRYFDIGGPQSERARLLKRLDEVFKSMQHTLTDVTMIRARSFELEKGKTLDDIDPYKETSPAPNRYAPNNRMSPAGISYMYLADKLQTCYKEIRAGIGRNVIVGFFKPRRDLHMLDLSITPKIPLQTIFDDNYDHDRNWIGEFVELFKMEISRPISDQDKYKDLEYVPTQVLAEYIRSLGYDGIIYKSSLVKESYNYVLFYGPDPKLFDFPLTSSDLYYRPQEELYFHDVLKLTKVEYRKVTEPGDPEIVIDSLNDIKEIERKKSKAKPFDEPFGIDIDSVIFPG